MKLVINNCYGGFGLSHEGVMRYAEIKGITLYPEKDETYPSLSPTYWTVPPGERPKPLPEPWQLNSLEARVAYNEAYDKAVIYDRGIPRDDPALVAVVEELGMVANGMCAFLKVVEVPDGVDWEIQEYDGNEWVAEKHRTWG